MVFLRNNCFTRFGFSATLAAILAIGFVAQPLAAQQLDADAESGDAFPRYLSGFKPSYLILVNDEDLHAEFYLSLKYPLSTSYVQKLDRWFAGRKTLYFIYNGKYDFYFTSRYSSPVVSRLQNPGLALKNEFTDSGAFRHYLVGWFHESNGQTIDTEQKYQQQEGARDFVSRGWDYLNIVIKSRHTLGALPFDLYNNWRLYCDCQGFGVIGGKEDKLFWSTLERQPDVRDYNGWEMLLSYTHSPTLRMSGSVRVGTFDVAALRNRSWRLEATYRFHEVPVTAFYFNGYGKEIAFYHEHGSYFGVGLEFW